MDKSLLNTNDEIIKKNDPIAIYIFLNESLLINEIRNINQIETWL